MIVTGILYPSIDHWYLWQHGPSGIFGYMLLFQWTLYLTTVWGGSFLISENGEQHDTLVLDEFYLLFGA